MKAQKMHLFFLSSLLLLTGGCLGYGIGIFQGSQASFPELIPLKDINLGMSTLKLMEVSEGKLKGEIEGGGLRLAYNSEAILELGPGEHFEILLEDIDLNLFYLKNQLPEGAHFIASSNGKYYYPILDRRSLGITPKNRVFFRNEEEAQTEGYLPR